MTAIGGKNQTYDDNGNLTNDGERTYVYDAENRLTAVKDKDGNTIASFTYRADGMRKTMTTGSKTITFHYDENKNVTHEIDGNNQVIASYTYADDQPISMTRGGKTYYYQTNYRGDVVALTDSAGAAVATYEYDAYGNLLKETGNVENPYRYAGYRYDKESGLYYLQSRNYNPETGRFLTRDTFEGFENEPLTLNKYAYGNNNPVVMVDPDGNAAWALGAVYFIPGVGQVALGVTAAIAIGIAIGATIHYVKKKTKSSSKSKKKKKKVQPKKTYTAKEMESIIKKDGWYQVKSNNGSHRQYKHKRKKGKVTIPWHKTLKKATADSILKQAGLK